MENMSYTATEVPVSKVMFNKGSKPAHDRLCKLPKVMEARESMPIDCVEVTFQKYDNRALYQWHYRTKGSVYWHTSGPVLKITRRKAK